MPQTRISSPSSPSPSPTNEQKSVEVHLQTLRTALENVKPPFCSGTTKVSKEHLLLFYGNAKGDAGRIDMSNASEAELKHLSIACVPATFGRNKEDVLDLSYRKAGKLDVEHFATKLDLENIGLINAVRNDLLDSEQLKRSFSAELYKLNVYGKGAFFKAHKDTPRGPNMFGSLVVVFPTPHEGGALLLRHGGNEWRFDSGSLLADKAENDKSVHVAYAIFFSDVEHEVTPVTSGYRITLTYNLYFAHPPKKQRIAPLNRLLTPGVFPPYVAMFKDALSSLLADPSFMPEGGSLGFGLFHQYPIIESSGSTKDLNNYLKGRDAIIMKVCSELSLDVKPWLLYQTDFYDKKIITTEAADPSHLEYKTFEEYMSQDHYGKTRLVKNIKSSSETDEDEDMNFNTCDVLWVNDVLDLNSIKSTYTTYGNEYMVEYAYGNVCLIVDVGEPGERNTSS